MADEDQDKDEGTWLDWVFGFGVQLLFSVSIYESPFPVWLKVVVLSFILVGVLLLFAKLQIPTWGRTTTLFISLIACVLVILGNG